MRPILVISALLMLAAPLARAERLVPPGALFRDPKFLQEFVGSYGILSDVEPKVSGEESQLLVKLRDLFEAQRFDQAEAELVRFIQQVEAPTDPEKQPGTISPAMVFVLGNLYFQGDRYEDARRAFKEAIRRFPRFRRAHTNLAFLYVSKNKFDEALPHLQRAVELGEGSHRVFGLLGYSYLLRKNPLAAENAYRQAYLLAPDNKDWKMGLAQALMMQEKLPEAVSLLDTLLDENPEDRQLWLQQANAYLGLDRKMDAATCLEVLRLKGLADEANLNLLGNIYMDQGEAQLALFAYLAAIEKAEQLDIGRSLKSARILNDYGYPEKAARFVAEVRTKAGDSLAARDLVELKLVEVRIAQAAADEPRVGVLLRELLELDPADSEVLLELARHYDRQAKTEDDDEKRKGLVGDARTNFLLAAEDEETAYPANLGYGQLLTRERRFIEALTYLERALKLKKSDSLEQYVSRVRRAADRQQSREERETEQRAARKEAGADKAKEGSEQ